MVQCSGCNRGHLLSYTFSHFTLAASRPNAPLLLHYTCLCTPFTSLTLSHCCLQCVRFLDHLDSICFLTYFREANVYQTAGEPGGVGRRHGGILLRRVWRPNSNCPLEERGGRTAAGQVLLKTTWQQQGAVKASLVLLESLHVLHFHLQHTI